MIARATLSICISECTSTKKRNNTPDGVGRLRNHECCWKCWSRSIMWSSAKDYFGYAKFIKVDKKNRKYEGRLQTKGTVTDRSVNGERGGGQPPVRNQNSFFFRGGIGKDEKCSETENMYFDVKICDMFIWTFYVLDYSGSFWKNSEKKEGLKYIILLK